MTARIPETQIQWGDKELGDGAFGVVKQGEWRGIDVALKTLKNGAQHFKEVMDEFNKEVKTMTDLRRHPNIVTLYGTTLQEGRIPVMVMELCTGGSLYSKLHSTDQIDLNLQLKWVHGIASGLRYIHENNIIHCDLKSLNILLSGNEMIPKIGDFGAVFNNVKSQTMTMEQIKGTLSWIAPELFNQGKQKKFSRKSDVYSLGVVIWEIFSRELPWKDMGFGEVYDKVRAGKRPPLGKNWPKLIIKIIPKLWAGNRHSRLEAKDVQTIASKLIQGSSSSQELAKMAEPGITDLEEGLGHLQQNRPKEAVASLRRSASRGNIQGLYELVLQLRKSGGSRDEIHTLLKRAVAKGHKESCFEMAMIHLENGKTREGYIFMKKAADLGHAPAAYKYGIAALRGQPIKKNLSVALIYLKKGAQGKEVNALYHYGVLCYQKIAKENPIQWLREASRLGRREATRLLAHIFDTRNNTQEALKYYRLLANQCLGPLKPR